MYAYTFNRKIYLSLLCHQKYSSVPSILEFSYKFFYSVSPWFWSTKLSCFTGSEVWSRTHSTQYSIEVEDIRNRWVYLDQVKTDSKTSLGRIRTTSYSHSLLSKWITLFIGARYKKARTWRALCLIKSLWNQIWECYDVRSVIEAFVETKEIVVI